MSKQVEMKKKFLKFGFFVEYEYDPTLAKMYLDVREEMRTLFDTIDLGGFKKHGSHWSVSSKNICDDCADDIAQPQQPSEQTTRRE